MHDPPRMQMLKRKHRLRHILPRPILRQIPQRLNQRRTIAPIQILHNQIQIIPALEREEQLRDERALGLLHQYHAFGLDVRDLVLGYHVRFAEDFDGEVVSGVFLPREENAAEGAFGDGLDDLEVFNRRGRCS